MSTTGVTAQQVMNGAAAFLNDTALSLYTYAVQLPYLNIACNELQEWCQLNNIPVSNETSVVIEVPADTTKIVSVDAAPGNPVYPSDLIEIQQLWTRQDGNEQGFTPLQKFEFIPHWWETSPAVSFLQGWAWINQEIVFGSLGASGDNEVKLDYIKTLFPQTLTADSVIGIIGSLSFLQYRTASLCAQYIGENATRGEELKEEASQALDRLLGIGIKGKQSIVFRRRPFMANWKARTTDW